MSKFRETIRKEAVRLAHVYNILCLEWATSAGKTLAALEIIESFPKEHRWLIVCDKDVDKITWYDEIKKHKKDNLLMKIDIVNYRSLHHVKYNANLILDEGHHITDIRLKQIKRIQLNKIVLLSATMPVDKKLLLANWVGSPHYYKININQLIDNKIIQEPKIVVIPIHMNNTTRDLVYELNKSRKQNTYIRADYTYYLKHIGRLRYQKCKIECTQSEYLKLLNSEIERAESFYLQKIQEEWRYYRWMQLANKRKKYLALLKTTVAKDLIERHKNQRFVCFGNEIKQIENLANLLNLTESLIHSNMDNPSEKLKAFNDKKLNSLRNEHWKDVNRPLYELIYNRGKL